MLGTSYWLRFGFTLMIGTAALGMTAPMFAQGLPAAKVPAIDADLSKAPMPAPSLAAPTVPSPAAAPFAPVDPTAAPRYVDAAAAASATSPPMPTSKGCVSTRSQGATYQSDDMIGAAEGVFGTGAHSIATVIQDILNKQGKPSAYIAGREAGGAIGVGLRFGSGTLCHPVDGAKPVYWTGPSIGFDAGASGGSTFVLVYNLNNSEDIYHRFGAGEGQAYLLGGFNVSYLRRGSVVLIPVRAGVGLRLGVNAGYMKISRKHNWFPL